MENIEKRTFGEQSSFIGKNWGWVLAAGIAYLILGVAAFAWPIASTVALTLALGLVLIASGVVQGVHAVQLRKFSGTGWRIVQAVAALGAGVLILRFPAGGMFAIAVALALFFFVGAASKWMLAGEIRPNKGWGWLFLSSVASLVLGVYILAAFPVSALWVPGAVLGIDLVFTGIGLIGLSLGLRKMRESVTTGQRIRRVV